MRSLHGPDPALLQVWTHQVWGPVSSVLDGAIEQVEPSQFAWAAVYHCLKTFPDGPLIHR